MAKNISLMGASYSDVPAVVLPQTGGGTARFDDASVTTATAEDVASGKVFLSSNGTVTVGTGSGGGAVTSVNGQTGDVVLDAADVGALPDDTEIPTKTSDLTNDSGYMTGMTILSYGHSTWSDFLTAYTANHVVYCRASSASDPGSGSQTRMAFMAYVSNATNPTNVEFQYYRSIATHSATQQGDQVFVYKLDKTAGWSVTTREAATKVVAGTKMASSYSSGTLTLNFNGTIPSTAADVGAIAAPSSPSSGDALVYNGTAWVAQAPSGGLSDDTRTALLNCFEHVAWIDDQGQTYYDELYNALHDGLVSISAVYTQTKIVDITDALDVLRPDLVVTATYGDGTTRAVTAYTLSGTLTVGTSTVTVSYFNTTATFTVSVTESAYITAVFTQPQTTIYTDDSLDSLKSYLVVTYYTAPGATGTVLADSAYTLVGTLTEGTSVITASYHGLTDTFEVTVVDFYNIHTWSMSDGNLTKLVGNVNPDQSDTTKYPSRMFYRADMINRRTYPVTKGKAPYYIYNQTGVPSSYYPIPVPPNANHYKITMAPTGQYVYIHFVELDLSNNQYGNSIIDERVSWEQLTNGILENDLPVNDGNLFMTMNSKYDSAGTSYPVEPTNMTIEFSEV